MHVKITTSGSRRYVHLVESYRDDAGKVKKRTVATLGRLDQVDGQLHAVIQGLMKVSGQVVPAASPSPSIAFESARALGGVWALMSCIIVTQPAPASPSPLVWGFSCGWPWAGYCLPSAPVEVPRCGTSATDGRSDRGSIFSKCLQCAYTKKGKAPSGAC